LHHFHLPLSNEEGKNTTYTSNFVNFDTSNFDNSSLFATVVGYLFYPSDEAHAIDLNVRTDQEGIAQVNNLEIFGCTSNRFFYHYRGSTTAPPCAERVDWFVYREPLPLKTSNYNAIKALINGGHSNSRNVQPLNGRKVHLVGDACETA
jgi:carbonic anhydrase